MLPMRRLPGEKPDWIAMIGGVILALLIIAPTIWFAGRMSRAVVAALIISHGDDPSQFLKDNP